MTSPPSRLASDRYVGMSTESRTNRTLPSPRAKLAPPGCMLPIGTSLYWPIRLAFIPELMPLVALRAPHAKHPPASPPRSQLRYRVPYCFESHDISAIMIVFEVPS